MPLIGKLRVQLIIINLEFLIFKIYKTIYYDNFAWYIKELSLSKELFERERGHAIVGITFESYLI